MLDNKRLELSNEEEMVVIFMRKYGPYADFTVEKRPSVEYPEGLITRIVTSQSTIIAKALNEFVRID